MPLAKSPDMAGRPKDTASADNNEDDNLEQRSDIGGIAPFEGSSNTLITTPVPIGKCPRKFYLSNPDLVGPPSTASSLFVPPVLVEHLMRNKKDDAIGVKFERGQRPGDQITNMEGALHTYVTPMMLANMHGDYIYRPESGHGIVKFDKDGAKGFQRARPVIVSAAVQPDFENSEVMLAVCALGDEEVIGQPFPKDFVVLDTASKQVTELRDKYDAKLRSHIVAHLLKRTGRLPSLKEVTTALSVDQTIKMLEDHIRSDLNTFEPFYDIYTQLPNQSIISVELLLNSAKCQLQNELWDLGYMAPQGFVYTSSPAVIFAEEIDATLLNRFHFAALKNLAATSATCPFENLMVYAFGDFADAAAVELLRYALAQRSHIQVVSTSMLFKGPNNTYKPLKGTEDALLVIHNNSDGFGQNIESEGAGGSLDGTIGYYSSAAASLLRTRPDLLDNRSRYF